MGKPQEIYKKKLRLTVKHDPLVKAIKLHLIPLEVLI